MATTLPTYSDEDTRQQAYDEGYAAGRTCPHGEENFPPHSAKDDLIAARHAGYSTGLTGRK